MADIQYVQGLSQLAHALRELPVAVGKKHLGKAVSTATKVIRDDAIQRTPFRTGRLHAAVLMKRVRGTAFEVAYIIGVRHGQKAKRVHKRVKGVDMVANLDAYYWVWLEFGTSKMQKRPFIRPAFEANKDQALRIMIAKLKEGLKEESDKLSWVHALTK